MRRWIPLLIAALAVASLWWALARTGRAPVTARGEPALPAEHALPALEMGPAREVSTPASPVPASTEPRRAADVEAAAEPAPAAPGWGRLELTVRAEGTDEPVPGLFVDLEPSGPLPPALAAEAEGEEEPPLRRGASPETDGRGPWTAEVRAGVAFALEVRGIGVDEPLAELALAPLEPDERRALTLEVGPARIPCFYVRVVAAEDGLPLPGASIVEVDAYGDRLHTDGPLVEARWRERTPIARPGADGLAALPISPMAQKRFAAVAPGRGPRVFGQQRAADTPEHAHEVPLALAASLAARVVDPAGAPVAGARVQLEASFADLRPDAGGGPLGRIFGTHAVERAADADGRCAFDGLTPGVAFRAMLRGPDAAGDWERVDPLLAPLDPGEARSAIFVLHPPADVLGEARDQHGQPASGVELLLLRRDSQTEGHLFAHVTSVAVRRVTTGDDGSFRLDAVPAGAWVLAPRPRRDLNDRSRHGGVEELSGLFAPLATPFEITGEERTVRVDLALWRDLYVRGRVVPAEGELSSETIVQARLGDDAGFSMVRCEPDGSFAVGPLPDVEVQLEASDWTTGSTSPGVTARAGDEGIELRLGTAGGVLSVHTVDATSGDDLVAVLDAVRLDDDGAAVERAGYSPIDAELEWRGLTPGRWALLALGPADRVGLATGIEVTPDETTGPVVIELERGGVLALSRAPDGAAGDVVVRCAGVPVADRTLGPGEELVLRLPPGEVVIAERGPDGTEGAPRLASLFAGERTEVVLGGE